MVWITRIILITSIFVLCSCHSAQKALTESQTKAIKEKVRQVHEGVTTAAENADVEKLFSYVAENNNGIFINNGNLLMTRQEALDFYKERYKNIKKINYKFDQQYITVLSTQTVIWIDQGSFEATTNSGQTFGSPFMQTIIFVFQDNEWKVFHAHASGETAKR
jgi:hypothetical protein